MAQTTIKPVRKKKIKKLLTMMNRQNERFLVVAPPLIEMMDIAVTDQDLDFLIRLGTEYYSYDQARLISGMTTEAFDVFFDVLKRKGFINIEFFHNDKQRFRLNAIVVGWYEVMMYYLKGREEEKRFSEKFQEYIEFFKKFNFNPLNKLQNAFLRSMIKPNQAVGIIDPERVGNIKLNIPINAAVKAYDSKIYPTSFVNDLIDDHARSNDINLFPCVCRHGSQLRGTPCSYELPEQSCLAFGSLANMYSGYGYGRPVSKSEAMDVLQEVREKGAIHSVIHEQDDMNLPAVAICNCCWDCCGILKPYNMGAMPIKYDSYYAAKMKADAVCSGCGTCEKFCPTTAVTLKDDQAFINTEKCIGCGQCAQQCPQDNIELYPDQRTVFLPLLKKHEVRISAGFS